jgi:hypothetical protein
LKISQRQCFLVLILACVICAGCAAKQAISPPKKENHTAASLQMVGLRLLSGAGLCGCYCGIELQVAPNGVVLLIRAFRECQQRDPKKYRDYRVNADLSAKHWQELQQLVDHDALLALPSRIGCASCTDGSDDEIEVTLSDGSKKSVRFPTGNAPKGITALSDKLSALESKLVDELPIGWNK